MVLIYIFKISREVICPRSHMRSSKPQFGFESEVLHLFSISQYSHLNCINHSRSTKCWTQILPPCLFLFLKREHWTGSPGAQTERWMLSWITHKTPKHSMSLCLLPHFLLLGFIQIIYTTSSGLNNVNRLLEWRSHHKCKDWWMFLVILKAINRTFSLNFQYIKKNSFHLNMQIQQYVFSSSAT